MTNATYSSRVIHGEYFPHIDGIRGLAVLPVVLFHILAALCPGGFAGVDVFFVISGYLITGGILRDLDRGRFSISGFYHRRIRRIMPAYFVLIAAVFAAGCGLLYAKRLVFLGESVAAGTLFAANFHFWMLGGDYFAPRLHAQPLLHLWSLSVEEQFYLFIPLLCAVIFKFRRRWVAPVLAVLAVLSLAGAVYAVMSGRQNSAFYLLQFRAWELLAGSLLAALGVRASAAPPGSRSNLTALLGLFLVLAPYGLLSSSIPFPGLAALPSVIGTVLLLRYGPCGPVSRFLSWRPLVLTGKASYSLYLWHWPVTVFWKYAVHDQLWISDYLGMFALSLLLGFLSWRFVEMPVRASSAWTLRRSFAFATAGITMLVAAGTACVYFRGWPDRLHPVANQLACDGPRAPFVEARSRALLRRVGSVVGQAWCSTRLPSRCEAQAFCYGEDANAPIGAGGRPELLLLGDSHAGSLQYGLDQALRELGRSGLVISRSATLMFDLNNSACQQALAELKRHPGIDKVVLVQFWSHYDRACRSRQEAPIVQRLETFARRIRAMNKELYILTDNPVRDFSPGDIAAQMQIFPPRHRDAKWDGTQSREEYERTQGAINQRLAEACSRTGAVLVPLHLGLLQSGQYPAFMQQNGRPIPLYRDEHHLSPYGSLEAAKFVATAICPAGPLYAKSAEHLGPQE